MTELNCGPTREPRTGNTRVRVGPPHPPHSSGPDARWRVAGLAFHLFTGGWQARRRQSRRLGRRHRDFPRAFCARRTGCGGRQAAWRAWRLAGAANVFWLALYTGVAGGVMALVVALARGYLREAVTNVYVLLVHWRLERAGTAARSHARARAGSAARLRGANPRWHDGDVMAAMTTRDGARSRGAGCSGLRARGRARRVRARLPDAAAGDARHHGLRVLVPALRGADQRGARGRARGHPAGLRAMPTSTARVNAYLTAGRAGPGCDRGRRSAADRVSRQPVHHASDRSRSHTAHTFMFVGPILGLFAAACARRRDAQRHIRHAHRDRRRNLLVGFEG